jgi:hypothetical protein
VSEQADPALRAWLDDVLALEDDARDVLPDFAEVVARAHALDPQVVTDLHVSEARELAPVLPLGASMSADVGPDGALADFLADVRADSDEAAEERRLKAIPDPAAGARRERRAIPVWAAAAAVLLVVGVAGAYEGLRRANEGEAVQAEYVVEPGERSGQATTIGDAEPGEAAVVPESETPTPLEVPPTPSADEVVEPPPAAQAEDPSQSTTKSMTRVPRVDRLRALDEQAQRRWRQGDVEEAQRLFREIIRLGRRGEYVELAYGDLFAIARDEGREREVKLWREYVRRFPKGRHADDARGGLCRAARGAAQTSCWREYLSDLPKGSYRHEASRALEGKP